VVFTDASYHLITFDPGSGATGWAHSITNCRAFSRPKHIVEEHIEVFDCGEFRGSEYEQVAKITASLIIPNVAYANCDFVSEDFELTQTHGGDDLLSPVRINAMIGWELYRQRFPTELQYQKRSLRTGVTRGIAAQWINRFRRFRKDEFAAVQHNITWLRRLKQKANQVPWKINGKWDCSCEDGDSCNLIHP